MTEQAPSSSPSRTGVLTGLALLLAIGLYGIVVALGLGLWRQNSPGEGLFPFLTAVAMTAFSALALAAALRERARAAPSADVAVDQAKLTRVGAYLLALVFYATAIDGLGFIVATLITVTFIMRFAERYSWAATFALAAGTAVGCQILFVLWLGAILPTGALWDRLFY
jgi:putative tricarboxylic transport membrane protein